VLKLSDRLLTLADSVRPGFPLWDICCDHGYLGLWLFQKQKIPHLYLVDESVKVIETLLENLKKETFYTSAVFQEHSATLGHKEQSIQVRLESGEKIPVNQLSGNIVIAGVGSYTVIHMLESWLSQGHTLQDNDRIIICAHKNVDHLRAWLHDKPYHFHSELLIKEKTRFREVIILEKAHTKHVPVPLVGTFENSEHKNDYFALIHHLKSLKNDK
jgi:tRNA (adenine22-N1)-methyltransferase